MNTVVSLSTLKAGDLFYFGVNPNIIFRFEKYDSPRQRFLYTSPFGVTCYKPNYGNTSVFLIHDNEPKLKHLNLFDSNHPQPSTTYKKS
jgi:hypothetical protein